MANLQVKDATAAAKYLSASGAGTDLDPHIVEHLDTNSAAMLTALQAIQTAVELIDNMISGNEAQVDVVTSGLPTGAATETTLAAIQTAVELIDNAISGAEMQVDVVSSALPTGAATEATLAAIQTAAEAVQTAVELIDNAISGTEMQVDVVSSALPTGAATEATLGAIQTAVELIDNMISGSEAQVDVVTSALPTGAATEATLAAIQTAVEILDNIVSGSEAQVDVVAPLPAGTNQIGDVVVNDIEDGAATSVMDAVNHAVKVNVVAGSGSGVSHTDDAAFTAGTDDVVPAAGIYQSSPDQVDDGDAGALRMTQRRTLLVSHETPAGDSMVDDTNDALKVNIVAGSGSGVTHTDDAAFTVGTDDVVPAAGIYRSTPDPVDDGDAGALAMSADRELFVQVRDAAGNDRGLNVDASGNIGITDAGGALTVDGTVTADAGTGPWPVTDNGGALTVDQATHDSLQCNANLQIGDSDVGAGNPVPISDNGGALTVDGTVTADAGTGPWPVTDNGGSLTVDDGGTALEVHGDAANDAAAAGNPVLVGGYYNGTIASGDEVDDGDAVRLLCDLIGGVVKGYHPGGWTANANYSAAQTDASVKAAPGSGLSLYVTDILFSTDTAMNFFLESSSTTMVPKVYLAANGGWSAHFQTPIKWPANTAITITSSAAGNHSIMINGYTAP